MNLKVAGNNVLLTLYAVRLTQIIKSAFRFIFFDAEFPEKCSSYKGPHSIDCANHLWKTSECSKEGLFYPSKLSSSKREQFLSFNLQ